MAIKHITPSGAGSRHRLALTYSECDRTRPVKALTVIKKKISGRNNQGKITIRHRGGAHKRKLRLIDFHRNKYNITGTVVSIQYDPNRSANIALINYPDGDRRYILCPDGLHLGMKIVSSETAEIEPGNALPLNNIPVGVAIHNVELQPGKGGSMVRSAGTSAFVQAKDETFVHVLLPSKEVRLIPKAAYATIGQVSNMERKEVSLSKAGRRRHMGWRPSVRGVAMAPNAHPHGGGEGRSGIGLKSPKTPWGKKALGLKTRSKHKYSNKYIIKDRRK